MSEKISALREQFKSALNDIRTARQSPQQTGIGKIINEIREYDPEQYREVVTEYKPIFEEWRKNNPETKKRYNPVILEDRSSDGMTTRIRISGISNDKPRIKKSPTKSRIREVKPEQEGTYEYKDKHYSKGRLVHIVIKNYINIIKPGITLPEIHKDWENVAKNKYNVCNEISVAKEHSVTYKRYFLKEDDILKLADGTRIAISKEWGSGNMPNFLERAKSFGIEIKEGNKK